LGVHRFYVPPEQCDQPVLTLPEREAWHAQRVLRVVPGQQVTVLDGQGHQFSCQVAEVSRKAVRLAVLDAKTVPLLPYSLTLVQAVPRGKVFDTIVQKATELATSRIVPLLSARVTVRLDQAQVQSKLAHWRQTAIEAMKQCGWPWLPRIEPPQTLAEFLARHEPFDLAVVGCLQPGSRHLGGIVRQFYLQRGRRPQTLAAWIGPEGDFTPEELAAIQAAGAQPTSLGPTVLRTDTAAVYCLAVLSCELQAPD